jgi:hypothetical protein
MHQMPLPFEFAGISDHRFYDRHLAMGCAPDGRAAFAFGMGLYKNMNVLDGFGGIQFDDSAGRRRQINRRLSRPLRPDFGSGCGRLRMEIVKPLQSLRYILEPAADDDTAYDLRFDALGEAVLEAPNVGRANGRLATDYLRYCQNGHATGHLHAGGSTTTIDRWFVWRDHSWGIRGNVGGFDPYNGIRGGGFSSIVRTGGHGMLTFGCGFAAEDKSGYITLLEDAAARRIHVSGHFAEAGKPVQDIVIGDYDIRFFAGSRAFARMDIAFSSADGRSWTIENHAVCPPWVFKGFGYDSGYNDGSGHGVYRSTDGAP